MGEDKKVEQHKEKNNNKRVNDNKREKRGQMMTEEEEASMEFTGESKEGFKGLLYGPEYQSC